MEVSSALKPPLGTFRTVAGVRLFTDLRGVGGPPVVFLPGAGLTGLDYHQLHERVAATRTSLIYDRAGTGWSERVRLPRSSTEVTDELRELLAATTSGPALLVGHSLGGLYARHYATRFPDATAGLILLDPAHEDYDSSMPAELTSRRAGADALFGLLTAVVTAALATAPSRALLQALPPIRRYRTLYRKLFEQELADWPAEVGACLVERHAGLDWLAVGLRESRKVDRLYAEVRSAGPLPDVPLVILSSTRSDGFRDAVSSGESEALLRAEIDAKHRLYSAMAATVSRGEVRTVDSGHVTLPFRQPDAVVRAIADLTG
jgi:pimeloyl-ACP methyl ester carboxylesterase